MTRSEKTPLTSFRDAYQVLQKHAQTLRSSTEPNIDDLLDIVNESVEAYKVCKERIDAVEHALSRALEDQDIAYEQPAEDEASSAGKDEGASSLDDGLPF